MAYNLEGEFYLIVKRSRTWNQLAARLTGKSPSLEVGEVAIKLKVSVPETLFTKPQLKATVIIPESAVSAPVIDATVIDNVQEILSQQTGMQVTVAVVEPTKAE